MFSRFISALMMAIALVSTFSSIGCNQPAKKEVAQNAGEKKSDGKKDITREQTKHEGWWCQEHGVPEDICSLCSDEAAAKFKKEGDWCKIHDRAQSQCFKCDPSKY